MQSTAVARTENFILVDEEKTRRDLYRLFLMNSTEQVLAQLDSMPASQVTACVTDLDADASSALHVVARMGNLPLMQELLARGCCQANVRDAHQLTALHVACAENQPELALELFLAKCDVDSVDDLRETALHKAVAADSTECMQLLLSRGADPRLAAGAGMTPVHLAAHWARTTALDVFLQQDPELVNVKTEGGWSLLHLAAHRDQPARTVTSRKPLKDPIIVRMLLDAKADIDVLDEDSKTPLHRAAETGNVDIARVLVEAGADVSAADICRWTPLHYACQDDHVQIAELLLMAKAPLQSRCPPCVTPLAVATTENQVRMAELLVEHNADPTLRAKGLYSPIMIARSDKEKYSDLLALFELGFVKHH